MVLVLNVLNSVGTDGSFGHEDSSSSVLAAVGRSIAPAFSPFGVTPENWPAAVGIFTGILAKEATVGTLNATYKAMAEKEKSASEPEEPFHLGAKLGAAFATIPENLGKALGQWHDPLGVIVADLSEKEAAAKELEVSTDTFGAMQARFAGAAGAFAYLLFILLYFPCAAAIAAVYQESGVRWTLFVAAWTTGMAYAFATLWYQVAHFAAHPLRSTLWITLVCLGFAASLFFMRRATHSPAELAGAAVQGV
jgi:ferrous iron transport protein B